MVLQREAEAPIWGWAKPGDRIHVRAGWLQDEVVTDTDKDGNWRVRLRTPAAGGPFKITITADSSSTMADDPKTTAGRTITLENVMIGEVWICSGQSNMEWSIAPTGYAGPGITGHADVLKKANYPNIRLFDVRNTVAAAPAADCVGEWEVCTPETAAPFSAVAYFFGRMLHEELKVPVGLITSHWSGTPAESWTSEQALRGTPELAARFGEQLAALARQRDDPDQVRAEQAKAVEAWWSRIEAADAEAKVQGWMNLSCDDALWETMRQPTSWTGELEKFDGIVWCRKAVEIPANWAGRELTLELGPIDDVDETYFNGVRVGGLHGSDDWATPRKYTVPALAVKAGRAVIAVLVLDTGGAGGINGKAEQMRLYPAQEAAAKPMSLAGEWRYHVGTQMAKLPRRPADLAINSWTPSALYNGMISPLIPFGIRGAIWYQGESNRPEARLYRTLFPALITDWRRHWGEGDFPFYYVQIAPYAYPNDKGETAELREAQMMTLAAPNTGMAVTMDIGDPGNIHPQHKDEVGRRLALWALAKTYGRKDLVYSGPIYKSMTVDGNRVRLTFDYVGGGLKSRDGKALTHFLIAGEDRKFVPAKAVIDGSTVVVSSDAVSKPAAVRYGWGTTDEPNLANAEGLPASSFRTDDWEGTKPAEGR